MARSSATAAFLLLLSLLAIAHCRTLQSEPATETTTVAVGVETGPPNPTVVQTRAGATEVGPAEQDGFLRLPSHRRHRHSCRHGLFHRHHWWVRHHGHFGHGHRLPHRGDAELVRDGEPRVAAEDEEVKHVAEPDPDRSLPDRDGEDGDVAAAVKRWRKEMLWRMFRHGLRHQHHHHHEEEDHEKEDEGVAGLKRFRHHDDEEEEDEEKEEKMRKLFHFHHHHEDDEEKMRKPFHHADDSDEDDDELEEMVRRFRKAIMKRRFHHGRHHHAEDEQTDGEQQREGEGVMTWIKGLMNRF